MLVPVLLSVIDKHFVYFCQIEICLALCMFIAFVIVP